MKQGSLKDTVSHSISEHPIGAVSTKLCGEPGLAPTAGVNGQRIMRVFLLVVSICCNFWQDRKFLNHETLVLWWKSSCIVVRT